MSLLSRLNLRRQASAPWLMIIITAVVVVLAAIAVVYLLLNNRGVTIDLYGSTLDPTIIQVESNLALLKNKFPNIVRAVNLHLVADFSSGQPSSYLLNGLAQPTEQQLAVGQLDIEEATRQLWLQKHYPKEFWQYLSIRNADPLQGSWEQATSFANIPTDKVTTSVAKDGAELLKQESLKLQEVRKKIDQRVNVLPFLFLNGELYRGRADIMSLSAQVAKLVLRNGRESLPAKEPISLFGGRVTLATMRHYLVNGIPEGYSDADCRDNPKKIGYLANGNTPLARCVYIDPPAVHLNVYTDQKEYALEKDGLIFDLEQDLKGMTAKIVALDKETQSDLAQTIKELGLKESLSGLKDAPYYIFEPDLSKDPAFQFYEQAKLVIQLPDGRYLLNRLATQQ